MTCIITVCVFTGVSCKEADCDDHSDSGHSGLSDQEASGGRAGAV